MELGIYTFADVAPEAVSGGALNAHRRIKELLEEIQLADQLGLDVSAVGEHHRPDYAISSPAVILGDRHDFDASRSPRGSLVVGSSQQVIDKILFEHELFRNRRYLAQMSVGSVPHKNILRSMELYGTKVAPEIRKGAEQLRKNNHGPGPEVTFLRNFGISVLPDFLRLT